MKKTLFTLSLFVLSFFTFSQSDSETVKVEIPTGNFNFAFATCEEEDSSKMFGGALEVNITNPENPSPIAGLLGVAYESQDWGDFSSNRWNFYLGLNAFFNAGDNLGFVGVKRTFYLVMAQPKKLWTACTVQILKKIIQVETFLLLLASILKTIGWQSLILEFLITLVNGMRIHMIHMGLDIVEVLHSKEYLIQKFKYQ